MKKKILFVTMIIFLLVGCSDINYKIDIKKGEMIRESLVSIPTEMEKVNLTENINFYNAQDDSPVQFKIKEIGKENLKVFATYENIQDFKESLFATSFFEVVEVNKDIDNITVIEATKYKNDILNCNNNYNDVCYDIDEIKITVVSEYKVLETNADIEDFTANTFEWILNKETINKNIYIKFSDDLRYDIIIKNIFLENKEILIAVSAALLLVAFLGLYFYILHRKVNEI
ncbi:MAG: hypothetical protein GX190_02715 [Mollicutes bacterium]|nr:hypothetical protein [Mollicutes bacterium]